MKDSMLWPSIKLCKVGISVFCQLIVLVAQAQDVEEKESHISQNIDSLRIIKYEGKNFKFTPFAAPSYSPELEVLLSAGGLMTFSLQKDNPLVSRSSIPFSFGYSSNGSVTGNIKANIFGRNDKWRLVVDYWFKDMPDHYWGVGYDNAINTPKSDSTTRYDRDWIKFTARLGFSLGKHFYLGPIVDINETTASNINERMAMDPDYLLTGPTSRNSGIGLLLQHDSRDFATNAYKGVYINLEYIFYGHYLGGQNDFTIGALDYRQYVQLKERHILAWEIKSQWTTSDSPWTDKSMIGSPWDLRGYFWGRFRDNFMNFGLIEYRHMLGRKKPNKKGSYNSRSGFAIWTGHGAIAPELTNDLSWIPNVGVGYRFEVQKRMNLRIDYGIGIDNSAVYFSFNEAF